MLTAADSGLPDHPRACGANDSAIRISLLAIGSSPRVRGKREENGRQYDRVRIIPARAGQTSPCNSPWAGSSDHPRACGAIEASLALAIAASGSSPRVRGKLIIAVVGYALFRIIPARAGQTTTLIWATGCSPDHPRACGANPPRTASANRGGGSSPRVRGKLGEVGER